LFQGFENEAPIDILEGLVHASTLFRLFRILPIILCLSMALLVTVLLVGCGNSSSGTINVVAGNGSAGFSGNGDTAIDAELNNPVSVAVDSSGNFYIADSENNIVRKVIASSGTISTVAGSVLLGYSGDNGPATSAKLNYPSGVAVDSSGNVYIADFGNNVIRKVTASSGVITTLAGNGTQGYSGDKGLATSAMLSTPSGVAVDSSGNLFIADLGNNVIREVAASSGIITTVAGSGMAGYSGDDGPAINATLDDPYGVAIDPSGNLYIADAANNVVREVTH